ncbi:hypothetical protein JCM12856_23610 [Spirochaeta dissipatitropha]
MYSRNLLSDQPYTVNIRLFPEDQLDVVSRQENLIEHRRPGTPIRINDRENQQFTLQPDEEKRVKLASIPVYTDFKVMLEVSQGDDILFGGISEPFRIRPGRTETVTIDTGQLELYTPTITDDPHGPEDGILWFSAYYSDKLVGYRTEDIQTSSEPEPYVEIDMAEIASSPEGIAVGHDGSLWLASYGDNTIIRLSNEQLQPGAEIEQPALVLSGGDINRPMGIAFDAHGNLWVAQFSGTLLRIDNADIIPGTASEPLVHEEVEADAVYSSDYFNRVYSVAFSLNGDAWIADSSNGVIRINDQDVISASGASIIEPNDVAAYIDQNYAIGLTFDAQGGLWIGTWYNYVYYIEDPNTFEAFVNYSNVLEAVTSRVDMYLFADDEDSILYPSSLAFGYDGMLWVEDGYEQEGFISRFNVSGIPPGESELTADVVLEEVPIGYDMGYLSFMPPPAGIFPFQPDP